MLKVAGEVVLVVVAALLPVPLGAAAAPLALLALVLDGSVITSTPVNPVNSGTRAAEPSRNKSKPAALFSKGSWTTRDCIGSIVSS